MKDKSRKTFIDVAKGIAMILVLCGHIKCCPTFFGNWLYSFHMPFFFALSGSTFYPREDMGFKEFSLRLSRRLLVPYLLLSLILWILVKPYEYYTLRNMEKITKSFLGIFLGHRLSPYYFSMWFIPVLFVSELLLFPIIKQILRCKKNRIRQTALASVVAIALILGKIFTERFEGAVWSLDLLPFGVAFVALGVFLQPIFSVRKSINLRAPFMWALMIIFLSINVMFAIKNWQANGKVDLYYCQTGDYLLFVVAAISGTIFAMLFSLIINSNAILEFIGQNTIVFYAFNNAFAIPQALLLSDKALSLIHIDSNLVRFILVLVLSIGILTALSLLLNAYFPIATGKNKTKKQEFLRHQLYGGK